MEKLLTEFITKSVTAEITARQLARDRLGRLTGQLDQLDIRGGELRAELSDDLEIVADLIGDGNQKKADLVRKEIKSIREEIKENEEIKETIFSSAIPKSAAALKLVEAGISRKVGTLLVQEKVKVETKAAAAFDDILDRFAAWDKTVNGLVKDLGVLDPARGIMAGSTKLTAICVSQRMIEHFNIFYALDTDVSLWRNQRADYLNSIKPLDNEPAKPQNSISSDIQASSGSEQDEIRGAGEGGDRYRTTPKTQFLSGRGGARAGAGRPTDQSGD